MGETIGTETDDSSRSQHDDPKSWGAIGLTEPLVSHLESLGYHQPTALQRALIPTVLSEVDTLIEAPAGTGRTVAAAAIVAELVGDCDAGDSPVALLIAPNERRCHTLVDCIQRVGSVITRASASGVRCVVASDLGPLASQAAALAGPLDVVVGTPLRLYQLGAAEALSFDSLEMILVDQADDITLGDQCDPFAKLLDVIEPDRQRVVMTSAVLPPLTDLLSSRLDEPIQPVVPTSVAAKVVPAQRAFAVGRSSPFAVVSILSALGIETPVVVADPRHLKEYRDVLHRAGYNAMVTSSAELQALEFSPGATVICADLPNWTDGYTALLQAATSKHAKEVILLAQPAHRQLLRTLGKSGGVQLNAAPLPSVSGTETRRVQQTTDMVAEQLTRVSSQPTPRFLSAVQELAISYDIADIAAAAMELAYLSLQREIQPGEDTPLLLRRQPSRPAAGDRRQVPTGAEANANRRKGGDRRGKQLEPGMTRLFVAAGYNYGVRPGDIVGAFAGESGLSGKEIGNIDIRESFTLVEVPERLADDVISAMQTGTIKGRQIEVRRERY